MSAEPNLNNTDYELLSAYIDEMLTDEERSALETRLRDEPALRRELNALRQTVALVNNLPPLKAPRNFTLTAEMVRLSDTDRSVSSVTATSKPARRIIPFPAMSIISAAASMVLIVVGFILIFSSGTEPTINDEPQPVVGQITNSMPPDAPAVAAAPSELSNEEEMADPAANTDMNTSDGVMDMDEADDVEGEMQDDGYGEDVTTFAMPTNPPTPTNNQSAGGAPGTNLEYAEASPSPMQTMTATMMDDAAAEMEMMEEEAAEAPMDSDTGADNLEFYATETALAESSESIMMDTMSGALMVTDLAPEENMTETFRMMPTPTVSGTEVALSIITLDDESLKELEALLEIAGEMANQAFSGDEQAAGELAPEPDGRAIILERQRQSSESDPSDNQQLGGIALIVVGILMAIAAFVPWWRQRSMG